MVKQVQLFTVLRPDEDQNSTRSMLNSSTPKIMIQIARRGKRYLSCQSSAQISGGIWKNRFKRVPILSPFLIRH